MNDNGEALGELKGTVESHGDRLTKLEDKVDGLVRFQAWLAGIATATGALIGFFSQSLKTWLNHP